MKGNKNEKRRLHRPHNNFLAAVLYTAILVVAVIGLLSAFFYGAFSRFAQNQAIEATRRVTESVCYSISEMNSSIRNLCVAQFSGSEVQYLMHAKDPYDISIQQSIARLKRSASSNLDIQAIITYNYQTNHLYSTYRGITDIDTDIKKILQQPDLKQLMPIPRILESSDYYSSQPVYSYVMYDRTYNGNELNCALIVNVNATWLSESLKSLTSEQERLVIFDDGFKQLACSDSATVNFETQVPSYCAEMIGGVRDKVQTQNGEKYYISVSSISGTNWHLLREVPYDVMLEEFRTLEGRLLLFTVLVFILAIALAFAVVRSIYKPIKKIAHSLQVQNLSPELPVSYDDLTYISQTLHLVEERYQNMQKNTTQIIQENLLRSMLMGVKPFTADTKDITAQTQQIGQALDTCRLTLIRIDNLSVVSKQTVEQKNHMQKTLFGIIHDQLSICNLCGVVDTAPGDFVVLLENALPEELLHSSVASLQAFMEKHCGVSVSVFLENSDQSKNKTLAPHLRFAQLQKISKYRMFAGTTCCLDYTILTAREDLPLKYPEEILTSLRSAMKRNDAKESSRLYDQFCLEARNNNVENYRLCMMQIFTCFQTLLEERNGYVMTNLQIDMDDVYASIVRAEYCSQFDNVFYPIIQQFCASDSSITGKHNILLESVKEYIDIHYADKDLSLKQIADEFHISQSYLGKLFREQFNVSIKEYITQVRLKITPKYLTQSQMSIKRIMDLSGFDNESNFYRLFREFYGVTPCNYRLSYSIEKAHATKLQEQAE